MFRKVLIRKLLLFVYVKSCCIYELNFPENIYCWLINCCIYKICVAIYCTYLLLVEGKSRISPERRYACAIEKALVGKTVSLRNKGYGACMSSMRSGQSDMVRDLPRGAMRAPLRKLSLEEANVFTGHFGVVLVVLSYILYLIMHRYKLFFWTFSLEDSSSNWTMSLEYSNVPSSTSGSKENEVAEE